MPVTTPIQAKSVSASDNIDVNRMSTLFLDLATKVGLFSKTHK